MIPLFQVSNIRLFRDFRNWRKVALSEGGVKGSPAEGQEKHAIESQLIRSFCDHRIA
jgi:hypothetical protein